MLPRPLWGLFKSFILSKISVCLSTYKYVTILLDCDFKYFHIFLNKLFNDGIAPVKRRMWNFYSVRLGVSGIYFWSLLANILQTKECSTILVVLAKRISKTRIKGQFFITLLNYLNNYGHKILLPYVPNNVIIFLPCNFYTESIPERGPKWRSESSNLK